MTTLKYTKDHEWLSVEGNLVTVGITDHAQQQLGDAVYVELPETGSEYVAGDEIAVIESVKAAGEIVMPLDGKVVEINEVLIEEPDLLNHDPMGDGWFFKVEIAPGQELPELMTLEQYKIFIEEL